MSKSFMLLFFLRALLQQVKQVKQIRLK